MISDVPDQVTKENMIELTDRLDAIEREGGPDRLDHIYQELNIFMSRFNILLTEQQVTDKKDQIGWMRFLQGSGDNHDPTYQKDQIDHLVDELEIMQRQIKAQDNLIG